MTTGRVSPEHGPGAPLEPFTDFEMLPAACYASDAEGWIIGCNIAAVRLWGGRPGAGEARFWGGGNLYTLLGDPLDPAKSPLALALADGEPRQAELIVEMADGSRVTIDIRATPTRDASGGTIGATALMIEPVARPGRGVTDATAEALRVAGIAARRLAAIIESSDDAILAKDLDGIITDFNRGAERLFGYSAEEVIGRPVTILIPADRQDEEPRILDRIRSGDRIDHFETVRQRKDGSLVDISLTISPIRTPEGVIVGASKIARDITERRRAEERQQLLLREMSHRVKNLFALAGSLVSLSARHASTPMELASIVSDRLATLARAHDLTLARSEGAGAATTLHTLARAIMSPFDAGDSGMASRVAIGGADLPVSGNAVTGLALLMHEFATNAAKYGALSASTGSITITTTVEGDEMRLDWLERGGPPPTGEPVEEGFGSVLVRATARGQLGGGVTQHFDPAGISIRLTVPVSRLTGI